MTKREVLFDFGMWLYKVYGISEKPIVEKIIDDYLKEKSIKTSTRRNERRADGSNSKAKKLCLYTEYCINQDKTGEYCLSDIQCDEKQSD